MQFRVEDGHAEPLARGLFLSSHLRYSRDMANPLSPEDVAKIASVVAAAIKPTIQAEVR